MKKLLLSFFSVMFFISQAQEPFITTWEVESDDLEITIPANTIDYTLAFWEGIKYLDLFRLLSIVS